MNPIPVRLSPGVRAAVEAAAQADGRSLSNSIHRVLERHVEKLRADLQADRGKPAKTRDKGRVIGQFVSRAATTLGE